MRLYYIHIKIHFNLTKNEENFKILSQKQFFSIKQCKEFLFNYKISDILNLNKNCIEKFFDFNFHKIFSDFFVNSNFLHNYMINKNRVTYQDNYLVIIFKYINKIL